MKKYYLYAESNLGRVRKNNEDNFFLPGYYREDLSLNNFQSEYFFDENKMTVSAVFDGIGGAACGEKASFYAAKALDDYLKFIISKHLDFNGIDAIERMNSLVCSVASNESNNMGSTVVMLCCRNNLLQVFNVGDSRGYFFRDGKLTQLSVDHNEKSILKRIQNEMGIKCDWENTGKHNMLTQHLGIKEFTLEPAVSGKIAICSDDIFLLCSDGLTGMLSDDDISAVLDDKKTDLKEKAQILISKALEAGGSDNITVSLLTARGI